MICDFFLPWGLIRGVPGHFISGGALSPGQACFLGRKPFFYKQASILHAAGVKIGFCYQGDMEAMGQRNLPFSAGTAVAYGLPYEAAIAALTLNTAQMLGIDKKVGSLTVGKEATFFISKGDALDMRTNDVKLAFIHGNSINLDNHQKALDRKYRNKYGLDIKQ